ncbi:MAG: hypothetical protein N2Z23_02715 [Pyrinomonadaceae bacterium]|nr:hypothetical protein [Pyrinomonadaceae bacterium]MCX7639339.1 hypothetical protein [Pyrinomonadaceae bacterium]MDW8305245.1 hypothetical protein [Acidobacteriota bacterium]
MRFGVIGCCEVNKDISRKLRCILIRSIVVFDEVKGASVTLA